MAEDRRRGHHLDDAGQRHGAEQGDGDADERREDGQTGPDQRAQHDEQDDRRDHEADGLAGPHDLRHPGGDGRREVDADAVDGRGREGGHEAVLGLGGDGGLGRVEHHRGDRGTAVLGHEADAGREVEQGRAGLELVGLGGDQRGGRVDLGLLVADGGPAGVDAGLAVGELLAARVDLGLLRRDGRLAGVQRLLAGTSLALPASSFALTGDELRAAGIELASGWPRSRHSRRSASAGSP